MMFTTSYYLIIWWINKQVYYKQNTYILQRLWEIISTSGNHNICHKYYVTGLKKWLESNPLKTVATCSFILIIKQAVWK